MTKYSSIIYDYGPGTRYLAIFRTTFRNKGFFSSERKGQACIIFSDKPTESPSHTMKALIGTDERTITLLHVLGTLLVSQLIKRMLPPPCPPCK